MTYAAVSPVQMQVAAHSAGDESARLSAVALADLSHLPKCGLKGPDAMQWLRDHARGSRASRRRSDPGRVWWYHDLRGHAAP